MAAKKRKSGWGGHRPGAGRPKDPNSGVAHLARPKVSRGRAVLVTLSTTVDAPDLRKPKAAKEIARALAASYGRYGVRPLRYELERGLIKVLVAAPNSAALSRSIQGLSVRIARNVNAAHRRTGKLFGDRYSVRVPKDEHEVVLIREEVSCGSAVGQDA